MDHRRWITSQQFYGAMDVLWNVLDVWWCLCGCFCCLHCPMSLPVGPVARSSRTAPKRITRISLSEHSITKEFTWWVWDLSYFDRFRLFELNLSAFLRLQTRPNLKILISIMPSWNAPWRVRQSIHYDSLNMTFQRELVHKDTKKVCKETCFEGGFPMLSFRMRRGKWRRDWEVASLQPRCETAVWSTVREPQDLKHKSSKTKRK